MIITLSNHKGGVGKTTTATTLARLLHLEDEMINNLRSKLQTKDEEIRRL